MNAIKEFHGDRAERFKVLPPIDILKVGPGSYHIDETTKMVTKINQKPSSTLGVCVTTATRFPDPRQRAPGPGKYQHLEFAKLLDLKPTSTREYLSSLGPKCSQQKVISRSIKCAPGPGTYDVNYAIGRHVANDDRFALLKSDELKWRDTQNSGQRRELRALLNSNDIFTDKRACRRMAHLALFYPAFSSQQQNEPARSFTGLLP
ncbi:uncharacterized protein BJ171DRAFT_485470 [Polychytrium aggregatum]|uniref:uncharacterized protein n=1 Tax=Polychytrium aggregatum TaxID=110093 RepID=UPI0022FDFE92|nr:uncharacterized protein BJ171DRAFT_485470 [Polychytrium aggregatum]KAI9209893.1 hypothetical protein BJ171DRAFT_485470 [Polychytrium aggregatum]